VRKSFPGHQEYLADPAQGVSGDAILGRIKARRAQETVRLCVCKRMVGGEKFPIFLMFSHIFEAGANPSSNSPARFAARD
jgi:hypothetical protein